MFSEQRFFKRRAVTAKQHLSQNPNESPKHGCHLVLYWLAKLTCPFNLLKTEWPLSFITSSTHMHLACTSFSCCHHHDVSLFVEPYLKRFFSTGLDLTWKSRFFSTCSSRLAVYIKIKMYNYHMCTNPQSSLIWLWAWDWCATVSMSCWCIKCAYDTPNLVLVESSLIDRINSFKSEWLSNLLKQILHSLTKNSHYYKHIVQIDQLSIIVRCLVAQLQTYCLSSLSHN